MSLSRSEETKYTIVFLGMAEVGKSAWIQQYVLKSFPKDYRATIGVDFLTKMLHKDGAVLRLELRDTAGQKRFAIPRGSSITESQIIVLVFDVTRPETLVGLKSVIDEVEVYRRLDAQLLLLANKTDLATKRQVSEADGQQFAQEHNCTYIETSAKVTLDTKAFEQVIFDLHKREHALTCRNLLAEVDVFQQKWPTHVVIQKISVLLKDGLNREDSRSYFNDQDQALQEQLRILQCTSESLSKSAIDIIFRVFAKLGVFTSRFDSTPYSELLAEINAFQQKWPNNPSIQKISDVLKNGLNQTDPQSYFNAQEPELHRQLRTLQWTSQSLLNSALNLIFTVFAKLGVYHSSVLESNQRLHGNRYRFYAFGEKQAAEVMSEKTITMTRRLGSSSGQ